MADGALVVANRKLDRSLAVVDVAEVVVGDSECAVDGDGAAKVTRGDIVGAAAKGELSQPLIAESVFRFELQGLSDNSLPIPRGGRRVPGSTPRL